MFRKRGLLGNQCLLNKNGQRTSLTCPRKVGGHLRGAIALVAKTGGIHLSAFLLKQFNAPGTSFLKALWDHATSSTHCSVCHTQLKTCCMVHGVVSFLGHPPRTGPFSFCLPLKTNTKNSPRRPPPKKKETRAPPR